MAWELFGACRRVFILSLFVLFASWVTLEVTVVTLDRLGVLVNVGLHLAFLLSFSGLLVGLCAMALQAVDGLTPTLGTLTAFLRRGPTLLLASCVYLIAVVAGLVLLVAPGVYVAARYALFAQVLAARSELSAFDGLRSAGALSRGRWGVVCRFLLLALVLNLAGAALLGVGLLVTVPVSLLAASSLFRSLQRSAV